MVHEESRSFKPTKRLVKYRKWRNLVLISHAGCFAGSCGPSARAPPRVADSQKLTLVTTVYSPLMENEKITVIGTEILSSLVLCTA
jgi:hypothetical protein